MPSWNEFGLWILQNLLWEGLKYFGIAAVVTIMARIGVWIFGKKVPRPKEIAFWATGMLGGTILLVLIYSVFIIPLGSHANSRFGKPNLHCEIMSAECASQEYQEPYDTKPKPVTAVMLWARIVNNGAPSSAWNWHLKAQLVSGTVVDSKRLATPVLVSPTTPGRPPVTLDSGQYLPWQLLDNPLANGASKTGWIAFMFDKSLFDELKRPGVRLSLEFQDVDRQTVSQKWTTAVGWAQ